MHLGRLFIKTVKWFFLSIGVLCVLLVAGGWLFLNIIFPPHDTDDVMLQNFAENRAVFEQIVTQLQQDDDIRRVDDNWYSLADGKARSDTPDRIVWYRNLFKNISTERGIYASYSSNGSPRILFLSNCIGMVTGGSSKGYLYDPHPKSELLLVDSIDDYDQQQDLWRSYWAVHKKN
ncbi:hypothetical protein [Salidesulfovibrio brasiliensis]|uniref:hypothetical protein n=1 Tax=Salidesulfovibrio brasiliensis TaxID=221711 RepID=UPI0006CFB9CC|nr:hypothetical protein [Salidesulfovibrio brasiliensis]